MASVLVMALFRDWVWVVAGRCRRNVGGRYGFLHQSKNVLYTGKVLNVPLLSPFLLEQLHSKLAKHERREGNRNV